MAKRISKRIPLLPLSVSEIPVLPSTKRGKKDLQRAMGKFRVEICPCGRIFPNPYGRRQFCCSYCDNKYGAQPAWTPTRFCSRCRQEKETAEFYGTSTYCRPCHREYGAAHKRTLRLDLKRAQR